MNGISTESLRRFAGRMVNPFRPGVVILVYHRIAELCVDPWALSVTPRHFAEHLDVLRRSFRPILLQHLNRLLRGGNLPHRAVVITFDDGYANNLYNAKPLLERYEVPATIYITSGAIGQEREFWWDELEQLVLRPGTLPPRLELHINDKTYHWQLGDAVQFSAEAWRCHRAWRAWDASGTPRHALYRSLYDFLAPMRADAQHQILDAIHMWAQAESICRPTHRLLTAAELVSLAEGCLIEIGAHTETHAALSTIPLATQREEIRRSKAQLETMLNIEVRSFAYPYGQPVFYTAETVQLVKEAAFTCACSTNHHVVRRSADPFQLPRIDAPDCDGDTFARWLQAWFSR
jgi:peptidoglycan/xylan/chitin deacetylase (PgdA/CDA1 family)